MVLVIARRNDEAIQRNNLIPGLLRFARNDVYPSKQQLNI